MIGSFLTLFGVDNRVPISTALQLDSAKKNLGVNDMSLRRSHYLLAVLFVAVVSFSVTAQTKPAVGADWDNFRPENEDFSILMPKEASTEITTVDYHKFQLNLRLYLSAKTPGPVLAVASMSGIKANLGSEMARFNSYADAFKTIFPPKVRKDAVTKMILTGSKPFHGYNGRIYKMTIGDLTGTVNAYVTRKRFYAVAVLNTKKDDPLEEKFLSSFVIPDKPVDTPATTAQDTNNASPNNAEVAKTVDAEGGNPSSNTQVASQREDHAEAGTANVEQGTQQPNQAQQAGAKPRAPIAGGMLNGKAIYMPLPENQAGQPGGVVMIQILIDEQGSVIDAKAVSGPPPLHAAAVNAARLARFMPTLLSGEPVKVTGTLAYNFAKAN
jgi:Gram-negative bacterial TonB protein C-terminal